MQSPFYGTSSMLLCVYKNKTETGDNSMDRYLFNKFVFEMDDELYDNSCVAIAQMSENIVKTPHSNNVTFNFQ